MNRISNGILLFDEKVTNFLLIVYFLFLILLPQVSIISLIILSFYFVYTGKYKKSFSRINKDPIILIFLGYYLLHVLGMIYSSNLQYGLNDLQTKLSFLIIPVLFAGINISTKNFNKFKISFIISSVVSLAILFFISAQKYYHSSDTAEFVYSRLAHNGHSTYLSVYFNLAILFILEKFFERRNGFSLILSATLFLFLYTGVLLLSARTATFVTIISVAFYPILFFGKNIVKEMNWLRHALLLVLMTIFLFSYLHFNNRFGQVEQEIVQRVKPNDVDSAYQEPPNSTNIRLNIWKNSIELIGRNLIFGVGTGDLKEELINIYGENNYQYGIQKRISPHNQFLHTGVILGILGILFLSLYLFIPFFLAIKRKHWLYVFFLVIVFVNCITESILEREAGILFFVAFNTCFYIQLRSKDIDASANSPIVSSNV